MIKLLSVVKELERHLLGTYMEMIGLVCGEDYDTQLFCTLLSSEQGNFFNDLTIISKLLMIFIGAGLVLSYVHYIVRLEKSGDFRTYH